MIDQFEEVDEKEQEYIPVQEHSTDPNEVVKFTQKLRYAVVDQITDNGKSLPSDPAELLSVLRDMDQSALTTRKLNIEEKSSNDGRKALETFRQLRGLMGSRTPLAVDGGGTIPLAERLASPLDGVVIPDAEMVPGEDFQGEQPLNIGNYVSVD